MLVHQRRSRSTPKVRIRPQLEQLESRALLNAGGLDATFGAGGLATLNFTGSFSDQGLAVALQPDGKMVVVGSVLQSGIGYDFGVARFNGDGTPDQSFGSGGRVLTSAGPSNDFAQGVTVQADGKIIVVGYGSFGGATGNDFAVVRYNSDGTLDGAFGTGGIVSVAFSGGSFDAAHGVVVQADGKIIVAGYSTGTGTGNDFALARLNSDGSLDPTFGTGGLVRTTFSSMNDNGYAVALQADGKIVLAGIAYNGTNDFAVARYLSDGQLDSGFGSGGSTTVDLAGGSQDVASALALQADGKIVLAGYSFNGAVYDFALVRLSADGQLDAGFDGDGKVLTNFLGGSADVASGVAVLSNGQILAGGYSNAAGTGNDFALVRYNADGAVDMTFAGDGRVQTNFGGSGSDVAKGLLVQTDGKTVLAGYSNYAGSGDDFALARYLGIDNEPPLADAGGPYTVAEGGSVALDGSASTDPNQPADTLLYEWDLDGDSVFGETGADALRGNELGVRPVFSAAGLDGPTSTMVWLRVTDGGGLRNTATVAIDVTNAAPSPDAGPDSMVNEGDPVTLLAQASDAGQDALSFGWRAQASNGQVIADGTGSTFDFKPVDDGVYTVTLTVTDDDGASTSDTVIVTVLNVAPTADAGSDQTVNEGEVVSLSGTFSDPGTDTWTFSWQVESNNGQVVLSGSGSSFSFTPDDNGTYRATFIVTDDDGGVGQATVVVTVNNVAPTAGVTGPSAGVPGQALTFTLAGDDAGSADVAAGFTYSIDWGDGSPLETANGSNVSHAFSRSGAYTIRVTATDKDGAVSAVAVWTVQIAQVQLTADPLYAGWSMLVASGTTGDDRIDFRAGEAAGAVIVTVNGAVAGTFTPTSRILAYGWAGNDSIRVDKKIALSAWLYGGDGDDDLRGGSGHDVLQGGTGNDALFGEAGRDLLIGGLGQDQLRGRDEDVLIGGTTAYDADETALAAILAEWCADTSYASRAAHLSGKTPGGKNGAFVLTMDGPNASVFDDQVRDMLFADDGQDWALVASGDKVRGK
jgi:uncharacterized delta-60 repeat protein